MNRQPYGNPPRWWEPQLTPVFMRLTGWYRWWRLHTNQKLTGVDARGYEHLHRALAEGKGVLITPNHSVHYDAAAFYTSMDRIGQPAYYMTAWQVFAMVNPFQQWIMQKLGAFSVDRESNDRQAFKQGVAVLKSEPYPLVIFPEGDVYHVSDHVTTFREGAAAIALSAAKRGERPIVVIPCGIKFRYVDDPSKQLAAAALELEERILLRPLPDRPLPERLYRLAECILALKEIDHLGRTFTGTVKDRSQALSQAILSRLESRHKIRDNGGTTPERVKALRQCIIRKRADITTAAGNGAAAGDGAATSEQAIADRSAAGDDDGAALDSESRLRALADEMEDLFFVMQLYSYPGDYLLGSPSIERIAETLDKFEEDILGRDLPRVRGRRRVEILMGEPIEVQCGDDRRGAVERLTKTMEEAVQGLLDQLSARSASPTSAELKPSAA
jgi:1-acyl-sn-glycerol-3-phosphate acyltransferase